MSVTRKTIQELLAVGLSRSEVARRLGISRPTVTYHCRKLGPANDSRSAQRYDWSAVQAYYDEGRSVRECQDRYGFSLHTWHEARKRGAIVSRPRAMPVDELLTGTRDRGHLKRRLLGAGLLAETCAECGLGRWRGRPLSLELHHLNGSGDDNRLSNLQLLCPNCHSQTDTWSGRNRRSAVRVSEARAQ